MERKEAIIELVQTEINYGNDLQILKEVNDSPHLLISVCDTRILLIKTIIWETGVLRRTVVGD